MNSLEETPEERIIQDCCTLIEICTHYQYWSRQQIDGNEGQNKRIHAMRDLLYRMEKNLPKQLTKTKD